MSVDILERARAIVEDWLRPRCSFRARCYTMLFLVLLDTYICLYKHTRVLTHGFPPTTWSSFWGCRGRPDPKYRRFLVDQKTHVLQTLVCI